MSADQMAALLSAAASNRDIASAFVTAATAEDVVAIARDLGYTITAEEVNAAGTAVTTGALSDAELAEIAGGGSPSLDPMLCPTGHCQSMYGLGC